MVQLHLQSKEQTLSSSFGDSVSRLLSVGLISLFNCLGELSGTMTLCCS